MASEWEGEGLSPKELLAETMRRMLEPQPDRGPLMLFVSPVSFDRGEDWVREAFAVGTDVEIVESLALPLQGEEPRVARRYPSAMRKP